MFFEKIIVDESTTSENESDDDDSGDVESEISKVFSPNILMLKKPSNKSSSDVDLLIKKPLLNKTNVKANKLNEYVLNDNECTFDGEIKSFSITKPQLCGIFLIAFDTKLGNTIEWQLPDNLNLKSIEFKAMASGLHLMKNDFM